MDTQLADYVELSPEGPQESVKCVEGKRHDFIAPNGNATLSTAHFFTCRHCGCFARVEPSRFYPSRAGRTTITKADRKALDARPLTFDHNWTGRTPAYRDLDASDKKLAAIRAEYIKSANAGKVIQASEAAA